MFSQVFLMVDYLAQFLLGFRLFTWKLKQVKYEGKICA